jgi:small basic protein
VLSELLDNSAYFSSYVGGFFMLFIQTLGQLEHLGVPLANVSLHLVVVVSKQRVFDVFSENLTLDKVSSLDKLIEGLKGDLNFFEFRVFC